jgi:hypothetical protein
MTQLKHLLLQDGYNDPLRFTAALSNGTDLYAFRFAINGASNTFTIRVPS